MRILIEPMLFGDYKVDVWDTGLSPVSSFSMLDKAYFCRGYLSAYLTALEIRTLGDKFQKLDIYIYEDSQEKLIDKI